MAIPSYLAPTPDTATGQETLAATAGGLQNANKIPSLNAAGQLPQSMMPPGVGPDLDTLVASEALNGGDFVNVWNDNGVGKVRRAVATAIGFQAHGYVTEAVIAGAVASVFFDDNNNAVVGRAPGPQYLSTTPGQTDTVPATGAGRIAQYLGVAVSAGIIHVAIARPIILAQ